MDDAISTPINTITRENLAVLISNNILNNSLEFTPDCDTEANRIDIRARRNMQRMSRYNTRAVEMDTEEFRRNYRWLKELFDVLVEDITPYMKKPTRRSDISIKCKMETDSPIRKVSRQPISKKLFHSPMADSPNEAALTWTNTRRNRKAKKRKQILIPDNSERIKRAYVKECEQDGYSPDVHGGMRKRVLISLFHNKEYCMDFGS